jgi:hypothetical protein
MLGVAGHPVAGQRVILYAWPNQHVTAALKPGQQVPLTRLGSAVTSGSGQYAIRVSDPGSLKASLNNGMVNMEVISTGRAGWGAFSFPRRMVTTSRGMAFASNRAGLASQLANMRLLANSSNSHVVPNSACGLLHFLSSFGNKATTVGGMWSNVPGVSMTFTYGTGQSSSLGVAIKGTVQGSTWQASGTHSMSSTTSIGFPTRSGAGSGNHFRTEFVYGLYAVQCAGQQTQATNFAGGATVAASTIPNATNCVTFQAGSSFHKTTTSAFNYTGGVEISGDIGIDLSAQTGYSTTAELTYTFSQTRNLCGENAPPASNNPAPKRIVAGNP